MIANSYNSIQSFSFASVHPMFPSSELVWIVDFAKLPDDQSLPLHIATVRPESDQPLELAIFWNGVSTQVRFEWKAVMFFFDVCDLVEPRNLL
jgi:hypothetical protein